MKRFAAFAALSFGVSFAALATTLVALDVGGLTRMSDAVVRAKVVRVQARVTADGARIMTDTELEVTEVLKGTPGATVVVMQPSGEVGDIGQHVDGVARFTVDEEVVAFLEARGGRYLVTGMVQGKFTVERPEGQPPLVRTQKMGDALLVDPSTHQPISKPPTTLSLDALREQVRAATVQAPPQVPGPKPVIRETSP